MVRGGPIGLRFWSKAGCWTLYAGLEDHGGVLVEPSDERGIGTVYAH